MLAVGAFPLGLGLVLAVAQPGYMEPMTSEPPVGFPRFIAAAVIGVGVIGLIVGYALMYRIDRHWRSLDDRSSWRSQAPVRPRRAWWAPSLRHLVIGVLLMAFVVVPILIWLVSPPMPFGLA